MHLLCHFILGAGGSQITLPSHYLHSATSDFGGILSASLRGIPFTTYSRYELVLYLVLLMNLTSPARQCDFSLA